MVVADDGWLGTRADWRSHAHRRVTLAVAAVSVHTAGGSVVRRSYRQPHPRSQQPPPATGRLTLSVASDRPARAHCRQRQPHHDGVSPATGWPGPVVAGDTLGQYDYRFDLVDEPRGCPKKSSMHACSKWQHAAAVPRSRLGTYRSLSEKHTSSSNHHEGRGRADAAGAAAAAES